VRVEREVDHALLFSNTARNRGRVAAALPSMMPRPGSTEERIASLVVLSNKISEFFSA
jgi:hypothetical protein